MPETPTRVQLAAKALREKFYPMMHQDRAERIVREVFAAAGILHPPPAGSIDSSTEEVHLKE